jgi:hypothetical protein
VNAQASRAGNDPAREEASMSEDFSETETTEALKLMRAFYRIKDLDTRRIIVSIASAAARGATIKIEEPAITSTQQGSRRENTPH